MLDMNAKLKFSKRMLLKLLVFSITFLGSQLTPKVLAAQNDFSGPGPFSVSVSTVEGQGLLFTPSNSDQKKKNWPGFRLRKKSGALSLYSQNSSANGFAAASSPKHSTNQ